MYAQKKLDIPAVWDFTEPTESWYMNKKDPERLLYVEATGFGSGMKTGDLIINKFEERIVRSIINFIEYTDKDNFRLSMIFLEFIN